MDSFNHKEKNKRIVLAKQLAQKGFDLKKMAEYFGVSESTVKSYLDDKSGDENLQSAAIEVKEKENQKIIGSLNNFIKDTISTKDFFKDSNIVTGRIKCRKCNEFFSEENLIKLNKEVHICKNCFKMLNNEELMKFKI